MNDETLLQRQIHPSWVQESRATSQAFRPGAQDGGLLSVYDGDLIAPYEAWCHYTGTLKRSSYGVCSVTVAECSAASLSAQSDATTFPEHAVIDFGGRGRSEADRCAKILAKHAHTRGWQYKAEAQEEQA